MSGSVAGRGFLEWLVDRGRMTSTVAERVSRVQTETSDRLAGVLLKLGLLSEADLAGLLCEFTDLQRLEGGSLGSSRAEIAGFNVEFARAHEFVPLAVNEEELALACWDVLDDFVPRACEFALGRRVVRYVGTRSEIVDALERIYPSESSNDVSVEGSTWGEDEEVDRLKDLASDAPVIRLVQRLIDEAIQSRASDIHLEPSEGGLQIRLRSDGLLRVLEGQRKALSGPVVSRIKVMAGLNIAERRLPQDGRIRVTVQGKEIDLRVATTPTLHGESVVLRILDRQDVALDFGALGFDGDLQVVLREAIGRPHGIVLVTGPTGSGKTTTLYASLKEINTPEKKIITVEDPVEYMLEGVNQVPVRPQIGLTFAHALRAFLRQDPDVLMVGEIRDRETAEIAVQAALTGHLLLSTLHTNTAAAAITRLLDMGIDDYLLTSTLHVILGQRLVRKLCAECREGYMPSEEVLGRVGLRAHVAERWYRPKGCGACGDTGFRGRTTIYEALHLSEGVRAKVLAHADGHEIEKAAVAEGMRTMARHGVERVMAGITSLDEVLRVTSLA